MRKLFGLSIIPRRSLPFHFRCVSTYRGRYRSRALIIRGNIICSFSLSLSLSRARAHARPDRGAIKFYDPVEKGDSERGPPRSATTDYHFALGHASALLSSLAAKLATCTGVHARLVGSPLPLPASLNAVVHVSRSLGASIVLFLRR